MIERLNFYDVYGYLLPGLALLGVLWFPFWLVAGHGVPAEWSSALLTLVLGYFAGHLLHRIAQTAFPHGARVPSDTLLDDADAILTTPVKNRLRAVIQERFGLDVRAEDVDATGRSRVRQDAFLLCRRSLLQKSGASYAEQFEGMYALTRGLTAVAVLSVPYHVGWAASRWAPEGATAGLAGLLLVGLAVMIATCHRPWLFWVIAALFLPLGVLCGARSGPHAAMETVMALAAAALGSVFVARRFDSAYHNFAVVFAATAYRDFYVLSTEADGERRGPPSLLEMLLGRRP